MQDMKHIKIDVLVSVDAGTGDIQITLCQALQLSGAVVVTTPQKLSYVDVVKGIDMFADLKVSRIHRQTFDHHGTCAR